MELCDRLLDAFVHQLLSAEPPNTALADFANGKDILAQRFLGFVETGRPDDITAPDVD
jgi:hypothetical protein